VETTVEQSLVDVGVEVYSGYVLAQWNVVFADDDDRGEVTSVSFTSDTTPLTLDCIVSSCVLACSSSSSSSSIFVSFNSLSERKLNKMQQYEKLKKYKYSDIIGNSDTLSCKMFIDCRQ